MGRHPPCSRLGWPLSQPVGLCSSIASVLPSGYPVFWQCLELFYTALPPEGKLLEMWFWGTWLTVEHFTIRASRMNSLLFIPEKSEFHYKTVYIKLLIKHLGWLLESKRPSGTIPRNCLNHLRPCLIDTIYHKGQKLQFIQDVLCVRACSNFLHTGSLSLYSNSVRVILLILPIAQDKDTGKQRTWLIQTQVDLCSTSSI